MRLSDAVSASYRLPCLRCLDRYRILLALALVCSAGLLAANTAHYSVGLCVCQHALRTGVDPGFVDTYTMSSISHRLQRGPTARGLRRLPAREQHGRGRSTLVEVGPYIFVFPYPTGRAVTIATQAFSA